MLKQHKRHLLISLALAATFLLAALVTSDLARPHAFASTSGVSLSAPATAHLDISSPGTSTKAPRQTPAIYSKALKRVKRSTTLFPRDIQAAATQSVPPTKPAAAVYLRKIPAFELLSLRTLRKTVLLR